jgi:hypothetical protein
MQKTVNQHSDAAYDLENEILREIEKLKEKSAIVTVNYVKSHGVKTKKTADSLVKEARKLPRQKYYYPFPNNNVNFIMNKQVISVKTAAAYHSIQLQQYLQSKHGWNTSTIDTIWWRIHHQGLAK